MPKKKPESSYQTFYKTHLNQVTTFSKAVAIALFVTLPFVGFLFGTWYGQVYTLSNIIIEMPEPTQSQVACTMDAYICPDGTTVGRSGPNCEFQACPVMTSGF